MPKPYIPDLDRVPGLEDEVRFYATIGIIVSVSGALERTLFQFYEKATGEMAAPVYYRARTDADRREMTNKAMRRLLAGEPELTTWADLYKRLGSEAETTSHRHLLAHNPVLRDIRMFAESPGTPNPRPNEVRYRVSQDPVQVAAGRKKDLAAGIAKLREICAELDRLHTDLDAFFATL